MSNAVSNVASNEVTLAHRRLDRVLQPGLVERAGSLEDAELLALRTGATEEEDELSYRRRLLQGRLDLLRAELERRRCGEGPAVRGDSDADLVAALSAVLVDRSRRGSGTHLAEPHASTAPRRRRADELAVDDVHLSQPADLTDDELAEAIEQLAALEGHVSAVRRQVQRVADALDAEVERRVSVGALPPVD